MSSQSVLNGSGKAWPQFLQVLQAGGDLLWHDVHAYTDKKTTNYFLKLIFILSSLNKEDHKHDGGLET